jgi:hypothetical protein
MHVVAPLSCRTVTWNFNRDEIYHVQDTLCWFLLFRLKILSPSLVGIPLDVSKE